MPAEYCFIPPRSLRAAGSAPYSSTSAFAGNPLLISLERLADRGWIDRAQIDALPTGTGPVDYAAVFRQKLPLLFLAARNFARSAAPNARARYENFCRQNQWWLDDFVLFDSGVKKLPRVHQYFGIKAAQQHVRECKGGIIWHTQGSGKSIVMVLLAKWILENWPANLKDFVKVFPHEYKRILAKKPVAAEKLQSVLTAMGSNLLAIGERA